LNHTNRGSSFKLTEGRSRMDTRKTFFYIEGGETLAWVAQRGGPDALSLETFKVRLDRALSNLI